MNIYIGGDSYCYSRDYPSWPYVFTHKLDIKPNILKKAIKLAHKSEFGREQQDHELLEQILVTVGKTL